MTDATGLCVDACIDALTGWQRGFCREVLQLLRAAGSQVTETIMRIDRKRSNLAQLTAKGRRKLAEAASGHVAAVRHLVIDALTGEQQRALAQISEAITARADAPAP
jgi:hypothetical protein